MSRVSNDALAQAFTHLPREEWTNDARRHFGQGWDASRAHYAAQEPTDAEVQALGRGLNEAGWTCHEGGDNPGFYSECEDCRRVCDDLARAALTAARAVGRNAR